MAKTIEPAGESRARRKPAAGVTDGGTNRSTSRNPGQATKGIGRSKTKSASAPSAAAPSRQSGGTVLGIIIGLIVGLGIAVVVAVMITKTTLPFTNKQAQPERQAGVTNGGQIADPNKPLYGNKEPAREAAKNLQRGPVPENTVTADTKPPGADASAAEKAAEKAADKAAAKEAARVADILGEKPSPADKAIADARMAEKSTGRSAKTNDKAADKPAARPDAADEKWIYYLQAGAFREAGDAESAKAKLALMGFEASISERPSDSGPLYRVRVGPFNQLEVMTRARSKLSDNGVDVAVVRTAR